LSNSRDRPRIVAPDAMPKLTEILLLGAALLPVGRQIRKTVGRNLSRYSGSFQPFANLGGRRSQHFPTRPWPDLPRARAWPVAVSLSVGETYFSGAGIWRDSQIRGWCPKKNASRPNLPEGKQAPDQARRVWPTRSRALRRARRHGPALPPAMHFRQKQFCGAAQGGTHGIPPRTACGQAGQRAFKVRARGPGRGSGAVVTGRGSPPEPQPAHPAVRGGRCFQPTARAVEEGGRRTAFSSYGTYSRAFVSACIVNLDGAARYEDVAPNGRSQGSR